MLLFILEIKICKRTLPTFCFRALEFQLDCAALEKKKHNLVSHSYNITSFLEEKVPPAMRPHFFASELNLFIILDKISSLW